MTAAFKRATKIGMVPGVNGPKPEALWVEIKWDGIRLSICGVVGPRRNGNCVGSAGQCRGAVSEVEVGHGQWTEEERARLAEVWERYHLNDMQAGSPGQTAELRRLSPGDEWRDDPRAQNDRGYGPDHFQWAKAVLAEAGLEPDPDHDDYRYGSDWLSIEVPADVLDWLERVEDESESYPWS